MKDVYELSFKERMEALAAYREVEERVYINDFHRTNSERVKAAVMNQKTLTKDEAEAQIKRILGDVK